MDADHLKQQPLYNEIVRQEGPWLQKRNVKKGINGNAKRNSEKVAPPSMGQRKKNSTLQITKEKGKERSVQQHFSNSTTILTGAKRERSTVLYLRNIYISNMTDEETARNVRKYGNEIGVRVMYCEVVHNRYCTDVAGCKIWIPQSQSDHALDFGMWPDHIACRKWEPKGK
jgi:hypothetical protein